MRTLTLSILTTFALAGLLSAQSPTPVVAPAVAPAQAPAAAEKSASLEAALKMLQDMKAANEETLQKQAAMLEQLDELEKAADQLRVYAKRG